MSNGQKMRFTFEVVDNGRRRGVTIEHPLFTEALREASSRLKSVIMDIEHMKTERMEYGRWIVVFDPFKGIV